MLKITEEAVVDEIAGFANFIMGESNNGVPAVLFHGCEKWKGHDDLYYHADEDIIRKSLCATGILCTRINNTNHNIIFLNNRDVRYYCFLKSLLYIRV